ncbi:MAG: hypothetical protein EPN30_00995 [Actinomycetota bacterium]|nr:MAG: hypothetical protein EPN30_00995 [Actinomycetota bacterium]
MPETEPDQATLGDFDSAPLAVELSICQVPDIGAVIVFAFGPGGPSVGLGKPGPNPESGSGRSLRGILIPT